MSSISSSDEFHSSSESSSLSSSSGVCPEDDPGIQSCNTTENGILSVRYGFLVEWLKSISFMKVTMFTVRWEISIKAVLAKMNRNTRMHSSRMRTVRSNGRRGGGGRLGCIPACTGQGGCPLWTEWQMLVKILPYRNYVADGNKCTNGYFYNNHEM